MKEIQGNMIMTGEGVGSYKAGGKRRHPRGGYILETWMVERSQPWEDLGSTIF